MRRKKKDCFDFFSCCFSKRKPKVRETDLKIGNVYTYEENESEPWPTIDVKK